MFFKIGVLQVCNFIKKRLQHRCFPVKLAKFLKTPFFKEQLWWLLLYILYTHGVTCNLSRWNNGYNSIYKKESVSQLFLYLHQTIALWVDSFSLNLNHLTHLYLIILIFHYANSFLQKIRCKTLFKIHVVFVFAIMYSLAMLLSRKIMGKIYLQMPMECCFLLVRLQLWFQLWSPAQEIKKICET